MTFHTKLLGSKDVNPTKNSTQPPFCRGTFCPYLRFLYGSLLLVALVLTVVCTLKFIKDVRQYNREVDDIASEPPGVESAHGVKLNASPYRLVCYYVIASENSHARQLPPEAVDPYYCTHIIVGFSYVANSTIQPKTNDVLDIYKKIIAFKDVNKSLKVLLSVEDISSSGEFSKMVQSENSRSKFATDSVSFLKNVGFDGIDLDWEFPSWPHADIMQVQNFSLLVQELRKQMDNVTGLLLSVAVASPDLIVHQCYEVRELSKFVDFVNVMCYDYHTFSRYLPLTGPNSPLYVRPQDKGYTRTLNVDWSATLWVSLGMPLKKINVGIPTFGHSFKLINEDNNGWDAPASGFGDIGEGGFVTYPNTCAFTKSPKTTHIFDDNYMVPYAFNMKEWMSYETVASVQAKASYVKQRNYGGAMVYSLNSDDFYGECGDRKFALTREINDILTAP